MVIFHSYVKLPEGTLWSHMISLKDTNKLQSLSWNRDTKQKKWNYDILPSSPAVFALRQQALIHLSSSGRSVVLCVHSVLYPSPSPPLLASCHPKGCWGRWPAHQTWTLRIIMTRVFKGKNDDPWSNRKPVSTKYLRVSQETVRSTRLSLCIINSGEHLCFEQISDDEGSSVWHVFGMCLASVWHVFGMCLACVWHDVNDRQMVCHWWWFARSELYPRMWNTPIVPMIIGGYRCLLFGIRYIKWFSPRCYPYCPHVVPWSKTMACVTRSSNHELGNLP